MKNKRNLYLFVFILITSALSCWVILSDSVYLGHDTLFHLSRIEGYANSLANGKLFPDIYPFKNEGFGYGSALFYCDFFLLIPSLLYNLGLSLTHCYAIYIYLVSLISSFTLVYACKQLTTNPYAPYVTISLFLFSNYRITNLYTRGALGEVSAMMMAPLLIGALAKLFIHHKDSTFALSLGLTGLIFSHNISFVLWCIFCVVICLLNAKTILYDIRLLKPLIIAPSIAFLLSACFTFAMIEQLNTQQLYVHYYGNSSNLNSTAQPLWTLFNPFTMVSGHAGYKYNFDQTMNISLGWLATLMPLAHYFIVDKKSGTRKYLLQITTIGYICLLLSTGMINFDLIPQLKILQFAFRFISIALPCLCLSGAIALCNNYYYPKLLMGTTLLLITLGIAHQYPYLHASLSIDSSVSYAQLLDGSLIDPYFGNSSYVRVEVAGADYLPIGGLNTKDYPKEVIEVSTNQSISFINDEFTINNPGAYILPKTYYKGYQVCDMINQCHEVSRYNDGRCYISLSEAGTYHLVYQKTTIHKTGITISLITALSLLIFWIVHSVLNKRR